MFKNKKETVQGEEATEVVKAPKVKFKHLPKAKKKKILISCVAAVVAVALLALGVFYLVKLLKNTVFKPNDIYYKSSYTVSDQKAIEMKDTVVATAGSEELTNGLLKMFYWKRATSFVSTYADYLSFIGLSITKPLDEQMAIGADDFTWQHYFIEGAIADWQRYVALYREGIKANIGLPEDLQEDFSGVYDSLTEIANDNGYESVEALIHDYVGVGVSYEDYLRYFEIYYLGLAYYDVLIQNIEISLEDIDAYFAENADVVYSSYGVDKTTGMAGSVRHILIAPVDEDEDGKYSEAEWQLCLENAQKYLQEWKDGTGTEESFAELAVELSEDTGSSENGGLYEGIYQGYGFVESFENWATDKSRQPGDTDIIQSSYGYHIMYYVSGEEAWISCTRELVREEKILDVLEEAMTPYVVKVDFKKIALDEMILATSNEE